MKLNNRTTGFRNGYICELTKEVDKLANLADETFFRHYILVYDYHRKQRCFPIRVPGGTVGNIWVDNDDVITKIVIETNYVIKTYPKNINELIQKFVGTVIEY